MSFPQQQPPLPPTPPRPPFLPYRPDPRVRELKVQVAILTALVVVIPLAAAGFFVFVLPFLNHAAVGGYSNDDGDKDEAIFLLERVETKIVIPHKAGKVSTSSQVCNSLSRSDPNATFSVTARMPLKGVPPADHAEVAHEVAQAWPGMLTQFGASDRWTVDVTWDSPTSSTGEITAYSGCPDGPVQVP